MPSADLGTLNVPVAKRIEPAWRFRASPVIQSPEISDGALVIGLILDLGFGIYKKITTEIQSIEIAGDHELAKGFAVSWCHNAAPNDLDVVVCRWGPKPPGFCPVFVRNKVEIHRTELDLETLEPIGQTSLADALVEQGLAKLVSEIN